jgi:VWFA-related protein
MASSMSRLLCLAALLFLAAPRGQAQVTGQAQQPEPKPAFPTEVELVTVDVVVVDRKGMAVPGLAQSDFAVLENGVPQSIARFEAVTLPAAPPAPEAPARRRPYSTNEAAEAPKGRTFVVVFDDIHLSPAQAYRAKVAVNQFLKTGVREADRVSLVATGGGAWWSARMPEGRDALVTILKRLDGRYVPDASPDRVTDWEAMRIIAYDDPDVGYTVQRRFDAYGSAGRERFTGREYADTTRTTAAVGQIDPYVRSRAQDVYNAAVSRRRITLAIMTRAVRSLADIKGRKAMILVSQGFIHEPDFKEMKQLVEASLRVNVPVYFIDTRGLVAMPEALTAEFPNLLDVQDTVAVLATITRDAEGSENAALDTGGFPIKNTNDLASGILRVSNESQAYYLLGYSPTHTARDGKFRRIEVRLAPARAKGLRVRARRGYYAPQEGAAAEAASREEDPEIGRALDSPFEKHEVPLRVTAFTFDETLSARANVMVAAEVDIRDLALREEDGRFKGELAFLMELQHRETGEVFRYDQKIEMAMLGETRETLSRTWYPVGRDFTLPSGGYQARVVVRDLRSGRLGSVIHEFEVPDLRSFRLSTPLLADTLEKREPRDNRPPRPVLQVRRTFAPDSTLYVQYSVFGAEKDEATRMPSVIAGYEIRRKDGALFKNAAPTRISPTSLGSLIRLHGISLLGAPPGEYELVLVARDEIGRKTVEVREPFAVAAAAPQAASRTP